MNFIKNIIFNKITIFLIIVFFVLALLYVVMLIDTNSVVNNVREIMTGEVPESETNNTPLRVYNHRRYILEKKATELKAKITRSFVLHNFFDGYMWVEYNNKANKNGETITASGTKKEPIMSRWKIHRENGKWKIVDITENVSTLMQFKENNVFVFKKIIIPLIILFSLILLVILIQTRVLRGLFFLFQIYCEGNT